MSTDEDLAKIVLNLQERAEDIEPRGGKWAQADAYAKGLSVAVGVLVLVIGLYIPHLQSEETKNQDFREKAIAHMVGTESKADMILMILRKELKFVTANK